MMQGWFELSAPAQAIPDSLKAKATLLGLFQIINKKKQTCCFY